MPAVDADQARNKGQPGDAFEDLAARVTAASERVNDLLNELSAGEVLLAGENIRLNIEKLGLDDQLRVVKEACTNTEDKCYALQDRMYGLLGQRDRLNREFAAKQADKEMLIREIETLKQKELHQQTQMKLSNDQVMKGLRDNTRRKLECWELTNKIQRLTDTSLELHKQIWREEERLYERQPTTNGATAKPPAM
jgi:hypothetical protein